MTKEANYDGTHMETAIRCGGLFCLFLMLAIACIIWLIWDAERRVQIALTGTIPLFLSVFFYFMAERYEKQYERERVLEVGKR